MKKVTYWQLVKDTAEEKFSNSYLKKATVESYLRNLHERGYEITRELQATEDEIKAEKRHIAVELAKLIRKMAETQEDDITRFEKKLRSGRKFS